MPSQFYRRVLAVILSIASGVTLVEAADHPAAIAPLPAENSNYATGTAKSVFRTKEFPQGLFQDQAVLRDAHTKHGEQNVTVMFYNADFQEVKQADKPGRYGAVVQLQGGRLRDYATLYRLSDSEAEHPELGLNQAAIAKASPAESARMAILLAGLSDTGQTVSGPDAEKANAWARDAAWWGKMRAKIGAAATYPHLVDLPTDYEKDPQRRWPLIVFLHGSGERGNDLSKVRKHGLAQLTANGNKFPAIIVSPQCPGNEKWQTSLILGLIDEVSAKYRVDPEHICVTGLSLGGFATWACALACPERLAAVAPICGASDPTDAARITKLPIWAFHGLSDPTVPVINTQRMIEAVQQAGGHPHVTLYPGVGHDSWERAYATDALYTWLLAQKRNQPEVATPGVPAP